MVLKWCQHDLKIAFSTSRGKWSLDNFKTLVKLSSFMFDIFPSSKTHQTHCQRGPGPCGMAPGKPEDQFWLNIIQIRPLWCELWPFYWIIFWHAGYRAHVARAPVYRARIWTYGFRASLIWQVIMCSLLYMFWEGCVHGCTRELAIPM